MAFFQFLSDYREQMGRDVAISVTDGDPLTQEFIERQAMSCGVFSVIEGLEYSEVEDFYCDRVVAAVVTALDDEAAA